MQTYASTPVLVHAHCAEGVSAANMVLQNSLPNRDADETSTVVVALSPAPQDVGSQQRKKQSCKKAVSKRPAVP
jgi:hypothetical protein